MQIEKTRKPRHDEAKTDEANVHYYTFNVIVSVLWP